jgi:hypothetical protein
MGDLGRDIEAELRRRAAPPAIDAFALSHPYIQRMREFVELMQTHRIQPHTTVAISRGPLTHIKGGILRGDRYEDSLHYELAPATWPIRISADPLSGAGIGINIDCALIAFARNKAPLRTTTRRGATTAITTVTYGPGAHAVLSRAADSQVLEVSAPVAAMEAMGYLDNYLVDASISLTHGNGPLRAPYFGR